MGLDLPATALGQLRFEQADDILGWSVLEICEGNESKLSQTLYTQPCLYVVSAILAELLQEQGQTPAVMAGHSLGEYVALFSAKVFNFESGLRLVKRRSELMDQASEGKMVALIGFDRSQLDQQVQQIPDVVIANDNHAGQVVISGTHAAVDQLLETVKVRRAVPLKVSGAFHSPLMAAAAQDFEQELTQISFQPAQIPVISNVDPTPTTDPGVLQTRLMQQMTGPVRWREICLQFAELGIEQVVEVGPGNVLTGLVKRTCPQMELANVSGVADLSA
jgi:[acyl-carrier-protein] S-malonyltransferase